MNKFYCIGLFADFTPKNVRYNSTAEKLQVTLQDLEKIGEKSTHYFRAVDKTLPLIYKS